MRKFIVGTDWWTDCDDAVALRILCRAHTAEQIQLLGIGVNACMEHSIPALDAFLQLEGIRNIPLGIDLNATDYSGKPDYQKRLAQAVPNVLSNEQAEDAVGLYRRLLAAAPEPVEILEIGYPNVLAALLASQPDSVSPLSGQTLVTEKVSKIWSMAGRWDMDIGVENNFARGPRSRQAGAYLCKHCPVPITFLGFEIGRTVITGGPILPKDHLYQAMCDHGSADGRESWDPMLVLLTLIGDEKTAGYSTVTGTATVDSATGANTFTVHPDGLHKYVIKDKPDSYYSQQINDLIR